MSIASYLVIFLNLVLSLEKSQIWYVHVSFSVIVLLNAIGFAKYTVTLVYLMTATSFSFPLALINPAYVFKLDKTSRFYLIWFFSPHKQNTIDSKIELFPEPLGPNINYITFVISIVLFICVKKPFISTLKIYPGLEYKIGFLLTETISYKH